MSGRHRPPRPREPRDAKEKLLCDRYLVHKDHKRAWVEAGYAEKTAGKWAVRKLNEMAPYLARMMPKVEAKVAQELGLTAERVLNEMTEMAFIDPMDYFEQVEARVEDPDTKVMVTKLVYRRKDPAKLTRAQRKCLSGMRINKHGGLEFDLVPADTRFNWLRTLGQHVGLFHEKIIHENHLHSHNHNHLTFRDVPTEKLDAIQRQLIAAVGPEVARQVIGPAFDIEGEFTEKP